MNPIKKFLPISIVTLTAIFLIAVKWPHLSLPCFWDEAYPYAFSIRYLSDHHLTIMPSGIPAELSTGHPPLFHFLPALWVKIFGTGMFVYHLFPLLISVITLFVLFRFGRTFFNIETGVLAVLLLATRAIFVAQASQMLPETMVTLFTILALHSWLRNNKWMYVAWASLLVLTKESGLVLPASLCVWEIISFFRNRPISIIKLAKNHYHTVLPFAAAALFFIVQRIQMGWFFFPMHIGLITIDGATITNKLWASMGAQLFLFFGGIAGSIIVIVASGVLLFRKTKPASIQRKGIRVIILFMIGFITFSCLNFYSPRYILCLYPFWFIIVAFTLLEALKGIPKFIPVAIITCAALFQGWYTFNYKTNTDSDLGYADAVKTQKEAVRWCVENGYREKEICASNQMKRAMTSDAPGFVNAAELFPSVGNRLKPETSVFIFTCTERDEFEEEAHKLPLKTVARFETGNAWTEICEVKK